MEEKNIGNLSLRHSCFICPLLSSSWTNFKWTEGAGVNRLQLILSSGLLFTNNIALSSLWLACIVGCCVNTISYLVQDWSHFDLPHTRLQHQSARLSWLLRPHPTQFQTSTCGPKELTYRVIQHVNISTYLPHEPNNTILWLRVEQKKQRDRKEVSVIKCNYVSERRPTHSTKKKDQILLLLPAESAHFKSPWKQHRKKKNSTKKVGKKAAKKRRQRDQKINQSNLHWQTWSRQSKQQSLDDRQMSSLPIQQSPWLRPH